MCYGEVISEQMLRARKEHRCDDCGKPICKSDLYSRVAGKYEGEFSVVKSHRRCRDINLALWDEYDEDMCYSEPRTAAEDEAKSRGWRGLLAMVRKTRARFAPAEPESGKTR